MNIKNIIVNPNKIKILGINFIAFIFLHYMWKIWTFPKLSRENYPEISKEVVKHFDAKQLSSLGGILSKKNAHEISIDFKHLPLLLYDLQYIEITTANPTPHPYKSTDTDFVVKFMTNKAILYR